jgi:hypothetical protein
MKCPLLKEVVVRYCKAYPVRKAVPSSTSDETSLCLNGDYCKCSEYQEITRKGKPSKNVSGNTPDAECQTPKIQKS